MLCCVIRRQGRRRGRRLPGRYADEEGQNDEDDDGKEQRKRKGEDRTESSGLETKLRQGRLASVCFSPARALRFLLPLAALRHGRPRRPATTTTSALKAWIALQEDHARRLGQPAPLTPEQRQALAVLVPPTAPPATDVGNDADKTDWVSLLMRYHAARNKSPHDPPEFHDEPVLAADGRTPQAWRCRCRLPREAPEQRFPEDHTDDDVPFQRKKDAKQHAARCAVVWLRAHRYMTANGTGVVAPAQDSYLPGNAAVATGKATIARPPPPPPLSPKPAALAAQPAAARRVKPMMRPTAVQAGSRVVLPQPATTQAVPVTTPPTTTTAATKAPVFFRSLVTASRTAVRTVPGTHDSDDEADSDVTKLASLCQMLRLGAPAYELWLSSADVNGFFDGRVQILNSTKGASGDLVLPDGVGVVTNVYTRKATREKLAQSVLRCLEKRIMVFTGEMEEAEEEQEEEEEKGL
ncbi:rRNA-processing protein efg1 [Niveomyces insectorum RCEF 264]|uniref:rRNA-processing protein efg1 n=1 Tax=Niveomyces insectorum RCEF 264 TaxID=1081102 RepID=A0A167RAA2_9HYPO|nr:rRNA-processing protein efg1 [Niveomyces insectorum RCEF 264]